MSRFVLMTVAAGILSVGLARAGETDEVAKLKADVVKLNQRLEAVEGQKRLFDGGDSWVDKISLSGDFRYRWDTTTEDPASGDETSRTRNRIRARLAVKAQVNEEFSFELRLATNQDGDPGSTDQTLDGGFSKKFAWIDLAYVTYKPEALKDYSVAISAGKVKNPFLQPGNADIIWDNDLTFEGGSVQGKVKIDPVEVFVSAGLFCVEERSADPETLLSGLQAGVKVPISDTGITVTVGGGGYWYGYIESQEFVFDNTDGFGNSDDPHRAGDQYEYGYNLVNVFGQVDFKLGEIPLSVFADVVQNGGASEDNTAWLAGLQVGKLKEQWNWQLSYNYRVVEKDAVLGAFTDGVFGGGRTNTEGHKLGAGLRIFNNVDVNVAYFICTNNIADDEEEDDYNRLQLDLNFKF